MAENELLLRVSAASPEGEARLRELADMAYDAAKGTLAPNTMRTYLTAWNHFEKWCTVMGLYPVPATVDLLMAYLESHREELEAGSLSIRTVSVRLAALSTFYKRVGNGREQPRITRADAVCNWMDAARRRYGTSKPRRAVTIEDVRAMVDACSRAGDLSAIRDRAVLLFGFDGALRRSELVAADVDDLQWHPKALRFTIRRSKTNQYGQSEGVTYRETGGTYCAVSALRAWMTAAEITRGPLFIRTEVTRMQVVARLPAWRVALIVKARMEETGVDPFHYAAHSLRAGFATEAAKKGHGIFQIAATTRHKSMQVLRGYVQIGESFGAGASGLADTLD